MEYKYLKNEEDKTIKVLLKNEIIKKIYFLNNGNLIITFNELDLDNMDLLSASIKDHLGINVSRISDVSLLIEANGNKLFFSSFGNEYQQLFIEKPNVLIFNI